MTRLRSIPGKILENYPPNVKCDAIDKLYGFPDLISSYPLIGLKKSSDFKQYMSDAQDDRYYTLHGHGLGQYQCFCLKFGPAYFQKDKQIENLCTKFAY